VGGGKKVKERNREVSCMRKEEREIKGEKGE
jgi:hypothetical protein